MTTSAKAEGRAAERLERNLALYSDLSNALRATITKLQAGDVACDDAMGHQALVRAHQKSFQLVLDIEARLGKRTTAGGTGGELDLDAARAEIRARLARWSANR